MSLISFSITDAAGTASLTIYGGDEALTNTALLTKFPKAYGFTTTVEQTISGNPQTGGNQSEGLRKWVGVQALLSEPNADLLDIIAVKGESARQDNNNPRITFNNEFWPLKENAPRTRAIASGSESPIASTGGIKYYAQHFVILRITDSVPNQKVNGLIGELITFDIDELDKTTP